MFKKRMWLGIILSIILMIFSVNGFAYDYKYTEESGVGFYVGTGDHADALENANELRQIVNDLGTLLGHSKMDGLYPKNGTTGGYLGRLNYGVDASKPGVPVVNDMYLATDTVKVYRCFVAGNWVEVYPGAGGATTFLGLTDTPGSYVGQNGKIIKVNDGGTALDYSTYTDNNITETIAAKHSQNADTALGTLTADVNMGTHKLTGLSAPSATGQSVRTTATITEANLEDVVIKKHTQNTDIFLNMYNALTSDHTYSGEVDSQPVGESVVFGDLLYFDWAAKRWKKTDADFAANMPGLRIALESKTDGQTCLMLVKGYIRDDSAFNFAGAMVYASVTPGAMSSTAPTGTGDQIQRVGCAKSADILFFDPSIDQGEI